VRACRLTPRLQPQVPATTWFRIRAACGIAGPVAFTAAWVAATMRQRGYPLSALQLSGLAAPDARDPEIMIAGFVTLGVGTMAFASAAEEALGGAEHAGWGPRLTGVAGAATIAVGLLRRDQLLVEPWSALRTESWHNHAHDLASVVAYVLMVTVPLVLARRFRDDPAWERYRCPAVAVALASAAVMAVFWSGGVPSWNAALQRVAVTLPLVAMAKLAGHMLRATAAS